MKYISKLKGGDLRSIGQANEIVALVFTEKDFDELFTGLYHQDRKVAMRTADAIEKITLDERVSFLQKHKTDLLELCLTAKEKEIKWHLALLISRLNLTNEELVSAWDLLTNWASDKNESKIVRVNSIQGLFNLSKQNFKLSHDFDLTLAKIKRENIPSLNARIKKLRDKSR